MAVLPASMAALYGERAAVEGDVRVELLKVQDGRDGLVLEREHDLDEPGDAGRALGVPHVRLHRADDARAPVRARAPQHIGERLHLDRIAQRGARAVRLDVADLLGRDASVLERLADHGPLREAARRGEHRRAAVLVHRRAADEREDPIAVGLRVGQALQDHDAATLAAHVPVRARVEGLAAAVG